MDLSQYLNYPSFQILDMFEKWDRYVRSQDTEARKKTQIDNELFSKLK